MTAIQAYAAIRSGSCDRGGSLASGARPQACATTAALATPTSRLRLMLAPSCG